MQRGFIDSLNKGYNEYKVLSCIPISGHGPMPVGFKVCGKYGSITVRKYGVCHAIQKYERFFYRDTIDAKRLANILIKAFVNGDPLIFSRTILYLDNAVVNAPHDCSGLIDSLIIYLDKKQQSDVNRSTNKTDGDVTMLKNEEVNAQKEDPSTWGRITKSENDFVLADNYIEKMMLEITNNIVEDIKSAIADNKDYVYKKGNSVTTIRRVQKERKYMEGKKTPNIYLCTMYVEDTMTYSEMFEEAQFDSFIERFLDYVKAFKSTLGNYISSFSDPKASMQRGEYGKPTSISISMAFINSQNPSMFTK